jgi:CheY-like chemotaxis protein
MADEHAERSVSILMAEDDEDDRLFAMQALREAQSHEVRFVRDGVELLDYLRRDGPYAHPDAVAPRPAIILLDLNMPKMDGREALTEIKRDPDLRGIPIVVLTTSSAEADIICSYELGASSFITKPMTFAELVDVMRAWAQYWLGPVELPPHARA